MSAQDEPSPSVNPTTSQNSRLNIYDTRFRRRGFELRAGVGAGRLTLAEAVGGAGDARTERHRLHDRRRQRLVRHALRAVDRIVDAFGRTDEPVDAVDLVRRLAHRVVRVVEQRDRLLAQTVDGGAQRAQRLHEEAERDDDRAGEDRGRASRR